MYFSGLFDSINLVLILAFLAFSARGLTVC